MRNPAIAGVSLLCLLSIPRVAEMLESTMTGQMLVQIPLLIAAGYFIGRYLERSIPSLRSYIGGIPGLFMIAFTILFWMLPRSLDSTLASFPMEFAKYVSLPLLAGVPLGVGWHRLGFIAKGFAWIHLISMVFLMSWLYASSPVRVCNRYLLEQQQATGRILFGFGIALLLYHAVNAVMGALKQSPERLKE